MSNIFPFKKLLHDLKFLLKKIVIMIAHELSVNWSCSKDVIFHYQRLEGDKKKLAIVHYERQV